MSWDHPRSCGKDTLAAVMATIMLGSPPLVRERHDSTKAKSYSARITPARAGKTYLTSGYSNHLEDHPRSCGKDA